MGVPVIAGIFMKSRERLVQPEEELCINALYVQEREYLQRLRLVMIGDRGHV